MIKSYSDLKLRQTEERLVPWGRMQTTDAPHGGWLRAIREALGMSAAQLARRMGVSQQSIAKLERNEATSKITLESLERVAHALGCRVTYAIVPEKPLAKMRRERALVLADSLIKPVAHSMKLEGQSVSEKETRRQRKELAEEFLRGSPRKLWR
jgi:predicted DNA-binding mobile mystery protein A